MGRIYLSICLCLLPSAACLSQNFTPVEADSVYTYFINGNIKDYKASLKVGLMLKTYYYSNNDTCRLAKLSPRIARCYERVGYLDSALQILHATEPWSIKCEPNNYFQNILGQSSIYMELEQWDQVLKIIDNSRGQLGGEVADSAFQELMINKAIALVYTGRPDEAKVVFKTYYNKALESGDYDDQMTALANLGALAGYTDDLDSAEYYLSLALTLCGKIDCSNQIEILQNLATLASHRDDYDLSRYYLDSAMALARESNDLRFEAYLHRELAGALSGQGRFEQALEHMFEHSNLMDTVNKQEIIERIAEYQELFESEKKSNKIKALELNQLNSEIREGKLRQTRNVYLFFGLVILAFAGGLYSRMTYIRKSRAVIEKEKNRSESLLLNILPLEVADELKEKGHAEARDFEMVSILFTDFVEFTQIAQNLSAKDLVSEINACFKAFDEIIQKYQIEKIKTIGDAYMAAGGLHIPRTSEPKDVVNAALEMQEFIEVRHRTRAAIGEPAFQMRVGIHTGPVVAGIVGVKKFQYDIWGDTVNTAARMESHGAIGKVNISEATYDLVKEEPGLKFESRGKVEVKGKNEMEMWFVERLSGSVSQ